VYVWHGGYWGPHVGFYGGINYGFGYGGVGFVGGDWRGGVFSYNRAVTNVNVTVVHNTYNRTVVNNTTTVNRVSYNGGTGGTAAQPTATELAAAKEQHIQPTTAQQQHEHAASANRAQLASVNHGRPAVAASARPGAFSGHDVTSAKTVNSHRPPTANNGSVHGPGGNTTASASKNVTRTDRPPAASNPRATTSNSNAKYSGNAASTKSVQNGSHANKTSAEAHANRQPATGRPSPSHPNNKPERP
jgi:hypothetical protein